jgi:hypothetical protein
MSWKQRSSIIAFFLLSGALLFAWSPRDTASVGRTTSQAIAAFKGSDAAVVPPPIVHIKPPDYMKALYMTSWVAGTHDWRNELVEFVKKSELNAIVIDIKDYTGTVSFDTEDPEIKAMGSESIRIRDIKEFIKVLHQNNIYVIGRIAVFQDPVFTKTHVAESVQKKNGTLWKDRKGLSFIDPSSSVYREYIVRIAKASERVGFDELNFDYIRFPSDGDMKNISFPLSGTMPKPEVMERFFKNLRADLIHIGVPISADLFGMTMDNKDDLNIGQVLERTAPYFDYIDPMVYPSHYPPTYHGFANPADHPYEVVLSAMKSGVDRMIAASSSPQKLRPWLQDFDMGATYDAAKVRAQIQATYDAGLTSWLMWDPGNKYTRDAYLPE